VQPFGLGDRTVRGGSLVSWPAACWVIGTIGGSMAWCMRLDALADQVHVLWHFGGAI